MRGAKFNATVLHMYTHSIVHLSHTLGRRMLVFVTIISVGKMSEFCLFFFGDPVFILLLEKDLPNNMEPFSSEANEKIMVFIIHQKQMKK
jgi:hypothetical protein